MPWRLHDTNTHPTQHYITCLHTSRRGVCMPMLSFFSCLSYPCLRSGTHFMHQLQQPCLLRLLRVHYKAVAAVGQLQRGHRTGSQPRSRAGCSDGCCTKCRRVDGSNEDQVASRRLRIPERCCIDLMSGKKRRAGVRCRRGGRRAEADRMLFRAREAGFGWEWISRYVCEAGRLLGFGMRAAGNMWSAHAL